MLNMEGIDVDVAQRIIDFASGSCYAISGNLQKISRLFLSSRLRALIFPEIFRKSFPVPWTLNELTDDDFLDSFLAAGVKCLRQRTLIRRVLFKHYFTSRNDIQTDERKTDGFLRKQALL